MSSSWGSRHQGYQYLETLVLVLSKFGIGIGIGIGIDQYLASGIGFGIDQCLIAYNGIDQNSMIFDFKITDKKTSNVYNRKISVI